MRLGQVTWNGQTTAAIFNHSSARPIPDYTLFDLICRSEKEGVPLPEVAAALATPRPVTAEPLIPLKPREVWACCSTDQAGGERPAIFFKGTARVCVGPGEPVGIRTDSRCTLPEPELALILGAHGRILGYTLANDMSARDLEQENPLYLSQSKSYRASCSLGPIMVTADEIADPHELTISWQIVRGDRIFFSGEIPGGGLEGSLEGLVESMMRSNPVPTGSVLLAGASRALPDDAALAAGDSVTIRVEEIGELTNQAIIVS
jgi:2-dehydro-3-deoxy-D-arabinonate dehydratase